MYAFMRLLESTPSRYERGIHLLTFGRIDRAYERIATIATGPEVLDIGTGAGGVAHACAARGLRVAAIDHNAGMLEVARSRPVPPSGSIEWIELGAAEIEDRFPEEHFDSVVSCLAFSEMSPEERRYVLQVCLTRLRPGGRLAIGDESPPPARMARVVWRFVRVLVAAITWIVSQTTSHPVDGLAEAVADAGFVSVREERPWPSFVIVTGRRPG